MSFTIDDEANASRFRFGPYNTVVERPNNLVLVVPAGPAKAAF